ncbi:FecR family protein [Chitinophaga silvatica]|uniref:FecR family protein n=2 Tax=Chitinophaga silvatica TaxID=2282649 RepID=A0A3E1Y5F5_9BACT|nr:FecR family protein [Chitinophaga silvatica]
MQKVADLLLARLQGTISETDARELEQWLEQQSPESREFYLNTTEWTSIEAALQSFYHIEEKNALEDVWARIRTTTPLADSPSAIRSMKRYWIAAAAAVLLMGMATTWYFAKPTETTILVKNTPDILPANNKATLQLADGSVITLDSTVNGTLEKEKNAAVINDSKGKGVLAYNQQTVTSTVSYNKITTPKGGEFQIVLPDGTHVWLNAASSLRYPTAFIGNNRNIELSGEAYFEVASNPEKQFRVKVTGPRPFDVEVLGTKFNISSYPDDNFSATSLVQGKVKVLNNTDVKILQPDQQAVLTINNTNITLQAVDLEEALAWKNGLFYIQDADIKDIMTQISRWYDVDIVYKEDISRKIVAKIPRSMKLSDVLKVLEYSGQVHFKLEGRTITVFP